MDKIFKVPIYQLYLFQLENYELKRFWKLLFKKGLWPKREQRKDLVWTAKARALFLLTVLLHLVAVTGLWFWIPAFAGMTVKIILLFIVCYLLLFLYFILYTFISLLLWPVDFLAKQIIVMRAKSRIKSLPNLKIIGIAGSYGKTTIKEIFQAVLSAKFKVASTPESVNTPVGIGRWILKEVDESIDIVVIEMGEHYKGDIKYLCSITPPDIAVVTGINEAHLERMKTMDNIITTIFEIVDCSKPKALVILNADDKNVIDNYKKYVWPDHKLSFFGTKNESNFQFNTESLSLRFQVDDLGEVKINLLGEYALGDINAAAIVAKNLGMSNEEIKIGIAGIKPVEHRLQPIKETNNILVIDDSYNGNSNGVKEAIKVLSKFVNRRKIYVTPGLAETGKRTAEVHYEIGQSLAKVVDVVILIKNSVTPFIARGLIESQFDENKIIWYDTALEAHLSLPKILQPNDVVLFQNDWGDQYI